MLFEIINKPAPVLLIIQHSLSFVVKNNVLEFSFPQNKIIFEVNPVGKKGDKGDIGNSYNVEDFIAGMNISGGKIVYMADGKIYTYNPTDENLYRAPIGISKTAALLNGIVQVQIFGLFYESGLGLVPDKDYYAADNGLFTQNPDSLKVCQYVGRSLDSDRININFQSPIITT